MRVNNEETVINDRMVLNFWDSVQLLECPPPTPDYPAKKAQKKNYVGVGASVADGRLRYLQEFAAYLHDNSRHFFVTSGS
jgi:hypothetical protein